MFWINHPSPFVSMYMKFDFFRMNQQDFIAKYFDEYLNSNLPEKKQAILDVLKMLWKKLSTEEKYQSVAAWKKLNNSHVVERYYMIEKMGEQLECEFLTNTAELLYYLITDRNYSTNYFSAMGLRQYKEPQ